MTIGWCNLTNSWGFPEFVHSLNQIKLYEEAAFPTLYSIGVIGFPSQTDWLLAPGLIGIRLDKAFTVIEPV